MPKVEPFEKNVVRYDEWFERNSFVYESELEAIRSLLFQSGTGIEIGVGTGRFAAPLGISFGVDPSKEMGEVAQQRGVGVIGGVAEALLFDDDRFDFALMVTTICFLDNIEMSFKEGYRVIKTGDFLIIGFVDRNSPLGKTYQKYKNKNVFYKVASVRP